MKHMVNLILTILRDIIDEQARRRRSALSVSNKEVLTGLVCQPEIKLLQLKSHTLDSGRTGSNWFIQQAN